MAIRMATPKRVQKVIKQSKENQELLDRLNNYVNNNAGKPVKCLVSFWKDQETVFTYKEIKEAILRGTLTEDEMEAWRKDYSKMVEDIMYPVWLSAIKKGPSGQPIFDGIPKGFEVDTGIKVITDWITTRGATFVTHAVEEQKKAIQALLVKNITDKYTVDELARLIRPCVGLTEGQTSANIKYYDTMKETLAKEHPKMKKATIEKRAREAQLKYAAKQHRERAKTIAHTEMAFAFAKGADEGVRQAQEQGLFGVVEKEWVTSGIETKVCEICRNLNGTRVPMGEEFGFKGRSFYPGQKQTPPAHPRCMCAIKYIEIEPPVFYPKNLSETETEEITEASKEFASGEEAEKYFGKQPDRSLRRSNKEEYDRQMDHFKKQSPYGKWSQQITSQEDTSITNYCGPDYSAINGLLRREMTENQVKMWDELGKRKVSEMISDIESAISKFDLPEDIKVFRTCENDVLEKLQTKIGSTFHDDGFVSTSVVRKKQASGNIFMEINIPKGQGVGAWVNPLSGKPEEYEFLLNRGTDFLVTDIGQDGADTIIRMKVTGRTKTKWTYATKEEVTEQWKRKGIYSEESAKLL